ncbi:hypothetical protein LTR37_001704 [Vermiconidia calcicola]|uniref:Uncharacterized protein n=1 Tax=Vermiconidia calcicola TaxID=1690605 RepID=A0ACC3NVZ5_9PEZI|nr:hypothetical protein LTR37_001704 [Vermiconidia calcicola]
MDDQGQDGPEETCPYPESDAPSPDESQGEDGSPPDNACPWLQNGDTTVSPNDEQGEDGNPNATCEWTRSVTVMAGGLAPAPWPTGHASELNVTCAGFNVHTGILSIDIRSLLDAAESGLAAAKTLNANSPGINSALCAAASFKSRASRLDGCEHIMDELSMVGWGLDELASLTSIKNKMETLEDKLTSAYSTKFCAPGCIALGGFLTNIMDEYNDLLKEATKALKLASAAFIEGNSAEMTSAMCALTNIGRITSRLSLCPDVNTLLSETGLQGGFNPASALAEAKSSQSSIMSRWKSLISCPTPTITNWNSLGEGMDWWLPIPFPKKKKSCRPPTISSLPPCTRVWATMTTTPPGGFPTRKRQEAEPTETVIQSCDCGTSLEYDHFPEHTGRNCGTTEFCLNEVTVEGITVNLPTMTAEIVDPRVSLCDIEPVHEGCVLAVQLLPNVLLPWTTNCICAGFVGQGSTTTATTFSEGFCPNGRLCHLQTGIITTVSLPEVCSSSRTDIGKCTYYGGFKGDGFLDFYSAASCVCETMPNGYNTILDEPMLACPNRVSCPNQVAIVTTDGDHHETTIQHGGNPCLYSDEKYPVECPASNYTTDEIPTLPASVSSFMSVRPVTWESSPLPETEMYATTSKIPTLPASVSSFMSVDSVRYSSGWGEGTEIQARHQKASVPDIIRPAPGSVPQSPPMETVAPVPPVPKSRAVFADEEGNAYEVIDGSKIAEYRPYPSLYRSRRSQTLQRSRSSGDNTRRRSHFPPGPPRSLKDMEEVVTSTKTQTINEVSRQVMVVEVRQMLSRVAELQDGTFYEDEDTGRWWSWFGM